MPEVNKITSRDNARLSHARKVRDGKISDEIFLEGLRLAEEALRSDVILKECFYTQRIARNPRAAEVLDRILAADVSATQIPDSLLDSIADTKTSQGIAMVAGRPETGRKGMPNIANGLFVFLNEVNDPSNLGAVFRTAEAAGVNGIILSKDSADAFSPKSLRAAMGANLRLPVWEKADVVECIKWAREKGIQCVAADVSGMGSYTEIDWLLPSLVIFGSEAHGLDDRVLPLVDYSFSIPMRNGVESLNLAVSAAIVLFEAVRQDSAKQSSNWSGRA